MRVIEWGLSLVCCAYAAVRGSARSAPKDPRHVIVMQMAKLGDMVCTTPLLRAIKKHYPQCEVVVVGSALNKELLRGSADVDQYVVFRGIWATARALRRAQYDFGVMTGPSVTHFAVLFLGGVQAIAVPKIEQGRSSYETLAYKTIRRLCILEPHRMGHYAPREYLRLLEPLGIQAEDTKKYLAYSEAARVHAEKFVASLRRPLIGIAPSAGNKVKKWPPERFAALSDALVEKYKATVIVFGGSRDTETVENMLSCCKEKENVINTLNRFSVDDLKATVALLDLFVSVDTGPIYIAEAFGVATVDIVGPMDEREQPPRGEKHVVVIPPGPRVPQLHIMNARSYNYAEARRQVESITVEMVLEACRKLLAL